MTMIDAIARSVKKTFTEKTIETEDVEGTIERFSHWDNNPIARIMFMIEGDRRVFDLNCHVAEIDGSTVNREKWLITMTKPGDRVRFSVKAGVDSEVVAFTNLTMTER